MQPLALPFTNNGGCQREEKMGGYTNGGVITLIISREDLEFLLGGLSVLMQNAPFIPYL
jgi:hypothetical protein